MKNNCTLWCLAAVSLLIASPAAADSPLVDPWAGLPPAAKAPLRPPAAGIIDPWAKQAPAAKPHLPPAGIVDPWADGSRSTAIAAPPSGPRAAMPPATRDSSPSRRPGASVLAPSFDIGVSLQSLSPELRGFFGAPQDAGVLVSQVEKSSHAAKAGVRVGDVLIKLDRDSITDQSSLKRALQRKSSGEIALLTVVRAKRSVVLRLTVPAPKPEDDALVARKNEIRSLRQAVSLLKTKLLELERRLELLEAGGGDPRLSSRQ